MKAATYLAVDLGAESGRIILGTLDDQGLKLTEVHRFANCGVRLGDHLHWDALRLWGEIKAGLQQAGSQAGDSVQSIGLDTWGVDFGLLDASDNLIGSPYHYRDSRTDGMMEAVFERVPADEVYASTGIQFMQLNSLYQLYSMVQANDPALSIARRFLNMPDLFNFFLTGEKANEFTISTTTQCYNPVKRAWAFDLLSTLDIPSHIFGEIVPPGTVLGQLRPAVADELGLSAVSVVAGAGHDTASAVAAVPASGQDYIYLSSGTWSLMGVELDQPLIDAESLAANMTNEGGVDNKIRFLKNIVGLWILQECRRQWSQRGFDHDYSQLSRMASEAPAFGPLVDPGDDRFLAPEDMVAAIQSYCRESGQAVPDDKGAIVRCVLESLAMEYRWVADQLDRLLGKEHSTIHIIGGGSQNQLLNQFTANATGKTVVAGPVEATAIGNILVQAAAMGGIDSLAEGREIVRKSFAVDTYRPEDASAWDQAYGRYRQLKR
ncbi:MAG: rhamnulokinase [Anaerolineae bacterium]|nr:rhamnulokinase [Anaerolineae bacterium]